jgi:hypothetical protein
MRATREQIQDELLELVCDCDTAVELGTRHSSRVQFTTISGHLRSLYEQGRLGRRWRGNSMRGCWEYSPRQRGEGWLWAEQEITS